MPARAPCSLRQQLGSCRRVVVSLRYPVVRLWFFIWLLFLSVASGGASWLAADEPRRWPVEWKSDQFTVHADFRLANPKQLEGELRQLATDLASTLQIEPGTNPVHLVLFSELVDYRSYMRHYFPSLPERRAIYIRDRGPGFLFTHWHAEVAIDIRHEVTHALLNRGVRPLPLWLDEGLAEYFEVAREARYARHPYLQPTLGKLLAGDGERTQSLAALEAVDRLELFSDEHYRQAWAWTHLMLHRDEQTRGLLVDYLRRHAAGEPLPPLSRLLQQTVKNPDAEYRLHFQQLAAELSDAP